MQMVTRPPPPSSVGSLLRTGMKFREYWNAIPEDVRAALEAKAIEWAANALGTSSKETAIEEAVERAADKTVPGYLLENAMLLLEMKQRLLANAEEATSLKEATAGDAANADPTLASAYAKVQEVDGRVDALLKVINNPQLLLQFVKAFRSLTTEEIILSCKQRGKL